MSRPTMALLAAFLLMAVGCHHGGTSRADSDQSAAAVSSQRAAVDSNQRAVRESVQVARASIPSSAPSSMATGIGRARADSIPVIVALVPDSASSGSGAPVELVLRGRNFAADSSGGNSVRIGPITLNRIVARARGTELHVTVPAAWSNTEAPPRPLPPGPYPVVVRTRAGESNVKTLRILP